MTGWNKCNQFLYRPCYTYVLCVNVFRFGNRFYFKLAKMIFLIITNVVVIVYLMSVYFQIQ